MPSSPKPTPLPSLPPSLAREITEQIKNPDISVACSDELYRIPVAGVRRIGTAPSSAGSRPMTLLEQTMMDSATAAASQRSRRRRRRAMDHTNPLRKECLPTFFIAAGNALGETRCDACSGVWVHGCWWLAMPKWLPSSEGELRMMQSKHDGCHSARWCWMQFVDTNLLTSRSCRCIHTYTPMHTNTL